MSLFLTPVPPLHVRGEGGRGVRRSARGAVVALLAAAPLALLALPAYAAGPKLSKGVNNALADEQKAYTAGDYKTAADDIAKARAVEGRTPEDDYWSNKIESNGQSKSNNMAGADQDAGTAAGGEAERSREQYGQHSGAHHGRQASTI